MTPIKPPLESIRSFCMACQGNYSPAVTDCNDTACPLRAYRHGVALAKGKHSPVRACKKYCHDYCQAGAGPDEVRTCGGDKAMLGPCPVFPFRMGTNPNITKATRAKLRKQAIERDPLGLQKTKLTPLSNPHNQQKLEQAYLPLR